MVIVTNQRVEIISCRYVKLFLSALLPQPRLYALIILRRIRFKVLMYFDPNQAIFVSFASGH